MISVIHPTSHFGPTGSSGSRVGPTFPGFTGQTALMASHDQISDLYRRRGSGYTHHVSNSAASWLGGLSGASEAPPSAPHQPQPRAVSSRSLSSYSSVSTMVTPVSTSKSGSRVPTGATSSKQAPSVQTRGLMAPPPGKDFSKPLFVDCSIEYELPNAPKIPKNSLPILMIDQRYQQKQQKRQQQQMLMNIKNKEASKVNSGAICKNPSCQCQKQVLKTGMKRSFANAMGTQQPQQFYKLPQQQKNTTQQHHSAAPHQLHAYSFEAPTAVSEAKRSRLMAEHQHKQQQQQLLQQYKQQQTFFQAQMQAAAALRHYQQSFGYRGYGPHPAPPPPSTSSVSTSITRPTPARPAAAGHTDMRISSFQQITPPESLAFWQQQQQLCRSSSVCRSACCTGARPGLPGPVQAYSGPCCPTPRLCCYAMPYPTPMVTGNPATGNPGSFGICCAQGKCQQVNVNKENLGIMRSL